MSREIKFRAWKWSSTSMLEVGELTFFTDNTYLVNSEDPDCELMQFTGLLDKNGVDIYEGDIVKYEAVKGHFGVHQIIYEDKAAAFLLQAITRASRNPIGMKYLGDIATSNRQYDTRTYELCEVIGNIYENPDLLEAKP